MRSSENRAARRGGTVRFLAQVIGLVGGGFAGGAAAAALYERTSPWAQFGYEFEGLEWAMVGAPLGALLGAAGVALVVEAASSSRAGLMAAGAAVGILLGALAGAVAGTEIYQRTHPIRYVEREVPPECKKRVNRPPDCRAIRRRLPRVMTLPNSGSDPVWTIGGAAVGATAGASAALSLQARGLRRAAGRTRPRQPGWTLLEPLGLFVGSIGGLILSQGLASGLPERTTGWIALVLIVVVGSLGAIGGFAGGAWLGRRPVHPPRRAHGALLLAECSFVVSIALGLLAAFAMFSEGPVAAYLTGAAGAGIAGLAQLRSALGLRWLRFVGSLLISAAAGLGIAAIHVAAFLGHPRAAVAAAAGSLAVGLILLLTAEQQGHSDRRRSGPPGYSG